MNQSAGFIQLSGLGKILICVLALMGLFGSAILAADNTKTSISEKLPNYEINLERELIKPDSVPNWHLINANFAEKIRSDGCDADEASRSDIDFYYDANGQLEAVTPGYVTFRVHYSVYCGGAHPSHGMRFMVYDVVSADEINVAREVPVQNYASSEFSYEAYEKFQLAISNLILRYLDPEADVREACPDTLSEPSEIVSTYSPRIAALGDNATAIILTYPPHVISVCQFIVSVPFSEVQHYFAEGSIIHERMD